MLSPTHDGTATHPASCAVQVTELWFSLVADFRLLISDASDLFFAICICRECKQCKTLVCRLHTSVWASVQPLPSVDESNIAQSSFWHQAAFLLLEYDTGETCIAYLDGPFMADCS